MAARVGTVFVYRTVRGDVIEDSVAAAALNRVSLIRRTTPAARGTTAAANTSTVTRREIRREADGYRQWDTDGFQLLTPVPWPPSNDWESVYRKLRYRYTYLGEERITVPNGTYRAAHLQLAIIGTGTSFFDLWVVQGLGIVRRTTRGGGHATDYELVTIRTPVQPQVAIAPPPPSAGSTAPSHSPAPAAKPSGSSVSGDVVRYYVAGGGWWFDREMSRRPQEHDQVSQGLGGWHVEAGITGPLALRGRYALAKEVLQPAYRTTVAPVQLESISAEFLLTLWSARFARVYAGGGGIWTHLKDGYPQEWTPAWAATLGVDSGVRGAGMSIFAELQRASTGMAYHTENQVVPSRAGYIAVAGLRLH
jgi:hypothetical protein